MKKLSTFLKATLSLLVLTLAVAAQADSFSGPAETVNLNISPFYLSPGETRTVSLGSDWYHVQKVFIQVSGVNSYTSTFQVVANGDVKGTIWVPGKDPSYVVTIGEVAGSLQLQHLSGGSAYVKSISVVRYVKSIPTVTPLPVPPTYDPGYSVGVKNEASLLARKAINIINGLQPYANFDEFGVYLLPIKKAAGRAYAAAEARGSVSATVHQYLQILKAQIDYATPYVDETFERSAVFELAIELKALGERLDAMLK